MALEVGAIVEGKVTGITNFGAFVELPDGKTGMVHISEVAPVFVQDIHEHVQEGQTVKVKILNIGDDGKISLSIKRTVEQPRQSRGPRDGNRGSRDGGRGPRDGSRPMRPRTPRPTPAPSPGRPGGYEWQPSRSDSASFEDMMSRFKQTSDEKISDLKRNMDGKHGGFSRRGGGRGGEGR